MKGRPDYMIAHGLEALLGESSAPPVREIDTVSGWKKALAYVKCIDGE